MLLVMEVDCRCFAIPVWVGAAVVVELGESLLRRNQV